MGDISQIETSEAVINPSVELFREKLQRAKGLKILDIGSGNRLSMSLKKGDLYVMADPNLDPHGSIISGLNHREQGSQIVGYATGVEEVPLFKPDLTLMVAPNPTDFYISDILLDSEDFIKASRAVLIVLDTRTFEATTDPLTLKRNNAGLGFAKIKSVQTLRGLGFDVDIRRGSGDKIDSLLEEIGIQRRGTLNSADLGATNIAVMGSR